MKWNDNDEIGIIHNDGKFIVGRHVAGKSYGDGKQFVLGRTGKWHDDHDNDKRRMYKFSTFKEAMVAITKAEEGLS